jgi:hypothetical protein
LHTQQNPKLCVVGGGGGGGGGGVHCGHVDTKRALVVMGVVADLLCVCSLVAVFFLPSI